MIAIDAKQIEWGKHSHWEIFTHGGRKPTGIDAIDWVKQMANLGADKILLTSMDRDDTKNGFDLDLTFRVSDSISVPVIASDGVGNLQYLAYGVTLGKADAVLATSVFHFSEHSVLEAKQLMAEQGINVRL